MEIVKKSPSSTHGFQETWNNLKDRFENKRILVNSQLKILFTLEPIKLESGHEIKGFQRVVMLGQLSSSRKIVRSFFTRLNRKSYKVCSGGHLVNICPKFLELSPERRFLVVKRNSLCINCLTSGHRFYQCKGTFSCSVCRWKHHTLLNREVSGSSWGMCVLNASSSSGSVCYFPGNRPCASITRKVKLENRSIEEDNRSNPPVDLVRSMFVIAEDLVRRKL